MARFRDFNTATKRETPDYLTAELRATEIGNQAIADENSLRQEQIQTGAELYDSSADMLGVTPIKDGFDRMFGSDGTPLNLDMESPNVGATPFETPDDGLNLDLTGDVGATPFAAPDDGLNLDIGVEDDSINGILNREFDAIDPTMGMTDAATIPADMAANTTEALDTASAMGDAAETLETASTLGAGVDGLAAAAGNIPVLGGISTLASAESPEQAAAELALMSNPYTGLLLSAYKMFS